ncbi:MAG: hypothetical protein QCI00_01705 [Candidatus Thermoplasmatota archaeon]|nr:hypothetical protein [Candidatus Thermoplasmatota archaeon]
MRIAVYATDHGYGHLSRQLAWIENNTWNKNDRVYIINDKASSIIDHREDLPIINIRRSTDKGPVFDDKTLHVDLLRTKRVIDSWHSELDDLVRIEKEWMKKEKIDLVISDISPVPIESAYQLGIRSLAVSSFSWHWIYSDLFPDHPILEEIKTMYRTSSQTFVLPLTERMEIFPNRKEISLISRTSSEKLKLDSSKKKVFISMGYSVFPDLKNIGSENVQYVVPYHVKIKNDDIRIPKDCKNITPYLEASDYAVLKTGYSSIAEAITYKKPIIAIKRKMIEDEYTARTIEKLGIGISYYLDEVDSDTIDNFDFNKLRNNYKGLPERFSNTGCKYVHDFVEDTR